MKKSEFVSLLADKIIKEMAVSPLSPIIPIVPQKKGQYDEEEFVLCVSDIQIGHKTKSFNVKRAFQRADYLIDRLAKITAIHRASHPVNNIHLFLLGDNIHNETIGRFLDLDELDVVVKKQVFEGAVPILDKIISFAAKNFKKTNIWAVRGNHGNMGKFAATTTNFDDVVYLFLKQQFSHQKNVVFHLTDNFFQVANVMGHRFLITHGDSIRMWMNIPYYGLVNRLTRWQSSIGMFDAMVVGHFHNYNNFDWNGTEVIVNGTWVTDDEYVRKNLGLSGSCCQVLFSVHPHQGITFIRRIKLDKRR